MSLRVPVVAAAVLALAWAWAGVADAETREGQGWQLEIVAPAGAKAGAAAKATVVLWVRDGWKLNTEYPFKLELSPGAGAAVTRPMLRKQDARRYDEHGAAIDVAITVAKAGTAEVRATVRFATCDDATCAPHKETFTITVAAK